tara:strand:+ start:570 stop:1211 length:642 start_codon:yes stop_codon:yes gene_type:complete
MKKYILSMFMVLILMPLENIDAGGHKEGKKLTAASSGFEGREEMLGRAMSVVLKSLNETKPYQHDINDALIKMILTTIQFAKNNDMIDELIENEVQVTLPMLERVRDNYQRTGEIEAVMVGMIDRTACAYQLFLDIERGDAERSWTSPFGLVLDQTVRLGQHDLTEEEVHEVWIKRRFSAFAEVIGVELEISDIGQDGMVSIKVVDSVSLAKN